MRFPCPTEPGKLFTLSRDRSGRIWIVGENGLFRSEGDRFVKQLIEGLPAIVPRADVRQSRDGRLWIALNKWGLFELRDGKAIPVSLGSDSELNRIYTFYIDSNNDFWFGLDGGGLVRWRKWEGFPLWELHWQAP